MLPDAEEGDADAELCTDSGDGDSGDGDALLAAAGAGGPAGPLEGPAAGAEVAAPLHSLIQVCTTPSIVAVTMSPTAASRAWCKCACPCP